MGEKAANALGPITAGVGAGAGIIQGIMAKKQQRDAEAAAERSLDAAKQQIEVNRLEALRVPTEVYERAFENTVAMQNQSLAALTEADPRALAAGVGKLQGVATQQDAQTRDAMAQALYDREKMVAARQTEIDQNLAGLDLQAAAGAQEAASQAQQIAAQGFSGAIASVGQAGQQMFENSALYKKNKGLEEQLKAAGKQ